MRSANALSECVDGRHPSGRHFCSSRTKATKGDGLSLLLLSVSLRVPVGSPASLMISVSCGIQCFQDSRFSKVGVEGSLSSLSDKSQATKNDWSRPLSLLNNIS